MASRLAAMANEPVVKRWFAVIEPFKVEQQASTAEISQ
jgi:hypothetical protein